VHAAHGYEKRAVNYLTMVVLAAIVTWLDT
jgi:hypothetical protein